jgi:hypothetical protein
MIDSFIGSMPVVRPVAAKPVKAVAPTVRSDPKSKEIGDVTLPWNVGQSIFRYKAPRALVVTDAAISIKEVVSPTGAPVILEAWKNGQFQGEVTLTHGVTKYPNIPLAALDEIDLRILAKGEPGTDTTVSDMWFLYCVV